MYISMKLDVQTLWEGQKDLKKKSHFVLTLLYIFLKGVILFNFCGLLTLSELYKQNRLYSCFIPLTFYTFIMRKRQNLYIYSKKYRLFSFAYILLTSSNNQISKFRIPNILFTCLMKASKCVLRIIKKFKTKI